MRSAFLFAAVLFATPSPSPVPSPSPQTTTRPMNPKAVEREFAKVERRLWGPDADLRNACGAPARGLLIEDRPVEREHSIEVLRSDVTVRGATAADLRRCARGIAKAGVVETWRIAPVAADDPENAGGGFVMRTLLLRARRDPRAAARRTEKTDKEAAAGLTSLWHDRKPLPEALAPELAAPDLVTLVEARWNAGTVSIEATADDALLADGYRRLIAPLVANGPKVEWDLRVVPPAVPGPSGVIPGLPETGLVRIAVREAPVSAVLRLFAELDRREFVMASHGATRTGSIAGGWGGLVKKIATELDRDALHVGAVDVLAPRGAKAPKPQVWSGRKVNFQLERVRGTQLWALLSAAGKVEVEGPDVGETDIHFKAVPWDQALEAIALAHGCVVARAGEKKYVVNCAGELATRPPPNPLPPGGGEVLSPLEQGPASRLRVIGFGVREGNTRWRGVLATPDGKHMLVQTGVVLGLERGHAVVDEHGVSLVLERADAYGRANLGATLLPF